MCASIHVKENADWSYFGFEHLSVKKQIQPCIGIEIAVVDEILYDNPKLSPRYHNDLYQQFVLNLS